MTQELDTLSPERVTAEESQAHMRQFLSVLLEKERGGEVIPSDENLYTEWESIVPRKEYGEVSLTKSLGIEKGFTQALESGTGDSYLQTQSIKGLEEVYLVKTKRELSESDDRIRRNHQPEFLHQVKKRLEAFEQTVEVTDLPDVYLQAYRDKIAEECRFCMVAESLGTPEFTTSLYSPERWSTIINVSRSKQEGKVVLWYEDQARSLLEQPIRPPLFTTVGEALHALGLTPEERARISTPDEAVEMDAVGMKELMEVAFARAKISTCIVEIRQNQTAMEMISGSRTEQICAIPANRVFSPDEVFFVSFHEQLHLRTTINGGKQGCSLPREGTKGYLNTQEGLSVISEMIQGEYFGHPRQREFAARYLAVAMALRGESYQEIYKTLTGYGIEAHVAGKTIWRVIRGTSLRHQDVLIPVMDEDQEVMLKGAECFPKDYVYFSGMMTLLEWFKGVIPVKEGMLSKKTVQTNDFSDTQMLARIGYAHPQREQMIDNLDPTSYASMKQHYEALVRLGKDALMTLLDHLSIGKMTFEEMTDPQSPWLPYFNRKGLISIRDMYRGI